MKYMMRWLGLTVVVLLSFIAVQAQDEVSIAEDLTGTFTVNVQEATFADDVLTIENVGTSVNWFTLIPELDGGFYAAANFFGDWGMENTPLKGVLTVGDITAIVEVTVQDLDTVNNTVSLGVVVDKIISTEEVKGGAVIPAAVTKGLLTLTYDATAMGSLQRGFFSRLNSTRAQANNCNPAVRPCN